MKKIVNRLILQSVSLLLIFACIIALLFGILFAKQTEDMHQEEMIHRSSLISQTLSDYFKTNSSVSEQNRGQAGGMGGYGAFLRFLNQIAGEQVWVLDEDEQALINYHHPEAAPTADLPVSAPALITAVYQDQATHVDKQRHFFQLQELTVATPIVADGVVAGVVLMHSQVTAIHQNQWSGYLLLLVSLLIAALIASLLAWRLAKRFVQPITAMSDYAAALADETYPAALTIRTKDELQDLGDQLAVLSQRLLEAQQARASKEQAEKDFLSQISHELRTPIMVMKSSLEAINDGYLSTSEEQEYLQQLLLEVTGLERLVNDLLELSRLESTEFQLQKEPIDLFDCINDALRSYRIAFQEKQQTVQFNNYLSAKRLIDGDYLRITQTLKILLDNANKYAPHDSLITLTLAEQNGTLEITIANQQQTPVDTQQLFDSFRRGEQAAQHGTGLGLAIARQVVRRHQGQITAVSAEGVFTIIVTLPSI